MKSLISCVIVTASLTLAGSTFAAEVPAFAKAKCGTCHALDKKIVGPAYKDIAAKYKGDKDAVSKMVANITKGGAFGWKFAAMPPKGLGASEAEIKTMAEFIAGLAQ
jgi:cytochrome c